MNEVMDGEETRDGADETEIFAELNNNQHLPNFIFDGYPQL